MEISIYFLEAKGPAVSKNMEQRTAEIKLKALQKELAKMPADVNSLRAMLKMARVVDRWFMYPLLWIGMPIPVCIRDGIYDAISDRRHALFGTQPCKRPPASYRKCVLSD